MKKNSKDASDEKTGEETPVEEKEETNLAVTPPANNQLATALAGAPEMFFSRYNKTIARVAKEIPSPSALQTIVDALPDEIADKVIEIIKKTSGNKKGVYSDDSRPDFTELRLNQGTGNDPNRPSNTIPGHFYLSTKENCGEAFVGTVIAISEGRTMWPSNDGGDEIRMPICQSMDRKLGSTYGTCETCPHKPWAEGKKQNCGDDVLAYMLVKDMNEIVKVRFSKTSEGAGRQLMRFVKRSISPWSRWYKITSDSRTSKTQKNIRWFVMDVSPINDIPVPEEIFPFCNAMCSLLEASIILPSIANIYRKAQEVLNEQTEGTGGSVKPISSSDVGGEDYGNFNDPEKSDKDSENV